MKWIDYREKLGIGFSDPQKFQALKNGFIVFFDNLENYVSRSNLTGEGFQPYFIMVGEHLPYSANSYYSVEAVENSILSGNDLVDVISKFIAFINTAKDSFCNPDVNGYLRKTLIDSLNRYNIQFSIYEDNDGIYVFPKGVPEMDDALVSAPLTWLKDYPNAEKAWSKALRAYSEVNTDTASRVADDFRKALERFFQEFFQTGDGKTLENCKAEYGKYLKDNGVPSEVSNNLETLLQAYTNYMNKYAKHTDKAKINVLEYLMYQTGNIIRLVIMLKQEEAQ